MVICCNINNLTYLHTWWGYWKLMVNWPFVIITMPFQGAKKVSSFICVSAGLFNIGIVGDECCARYYLQDSILYLDSVPSQEIGWEKTSPKWHILCRMGHKTLT